MDLELFRFQVKPVLRMLTEFVTLGPWMLGKSWSRSSGTRSTATGRLCLRGTLWGTPGCEDLLRSFLGRLSSRSSSRGAPGTRFFAFLYFFSIFYVFCNFFTKLKSELKSLDTAIALVKYVLILFFIRRPKEGEAVYLSRKSD